MHNLESVRETETHNLLCDFELQKDNLISIKWSDLVTINKKR